MIIKLVPGASREAVNIVAEALNAIQLPFKYTEHYKQRAFILFAAPATEQMAMLNGLAAVESIVDFRKDYVLASRAFKQSDTCFTVEGQLMGGQSFNVIAGPCSVESEEQIFTIAEYLHKLGIKFIRGGAYKPRTSPYSFQGLGHEGLKLIKKAADEYGLKVVTEIIDSTLIEEIYPYADILQVGSRNMQNFFFLKQLGRQQKPVLLKRSMYGRIDEWLLAAEYILSEGNEKVILCERGIRTFDTTVRNTMDIAAIPLIKQLSHLPIIADPSHGTGRRDLVVPVGLAAAAAGADGLMIEVHPDPPKALSDASQTIYFEQLENLVRQLGIVLGVTGKKLNLNNTEIQNHQSICVE